MAAVEVFGPRLVNKGDELMLRAIVARLGGAHRLGAAPGHGIDRPPRDEGLREVYWPPRPTEPLEALRRRSRTRLLSAVKRSALMVVPRAAAASRGYVRGTELDALLDASGFAYGDQWPARRLNRRADYFRRLADHGVRLVMLPQALGPFEGPEVRAAMAAMLAHFDLVFARESASRAHVEKLDGISARVAVAPDITHLLPGVLPPDADAWRSTVCVIPNTRMLDKTDPEVSRRYVDFMRGCIRGIRRRGLSPALVIHEHNDHPIATEIGRGHDAPVPVHDEGALETKGILGACRAVLGSRYHGIVSALSQGTPTLGTSWTHKYDELFEEYGCPECLVSPLDGEGVVDQKLDRLLDPAGHAELRARIEPAAETQKEKVRRMWELVETYIPGGTGSARMEAER